LYRHPLVDINNINVTGQRICSHFLVQIPRADAEIVTNKLPLIFFFFINMLDNCTWKCENNLDKMVYAYLTPDFCKHISRELWYILFVWSFSVMRFLRPLLKHLTQLVNFITRTWSKTFFWTTVMRIVQPMTDRSRYFNPSKNYWFNFNAAFLISLIGLYFRCKYTLGVFVDSYMDSPTISAFVCL
jgi:hypothetical protein